VFNYPNIPTRPYPCVSCAGLGHTANNHPPPSWARFPSICSGEACQEPDHRLAGTSPHKRASSSNTNPAKHSTAQHSRTEHRRRTEQNHMERMELNTTEYPKRLEARWPAPFCGKFNTTSSNRDHLCSPTALLSRQPRSAARLHSRMQSQSNHNENRLGEP